MEELYKELVHYNGGDKVHMNSLGDGKYEIILQPFSSFHSGTLIGHKDITFEVYSDCIKLLNY